MSTFAQSLSAIVALTALQQLLNLFWETGNICVLRMYGARVHVYLCVYVHVHACCVCVCVYVTTRVHALETCLVYELSNFIGYIVSMVFIFWQKTFQ